MSSQILRLIPGEEWPSPMSGQRIGVVKPRDQTLIVVWSGMMNGRGKGVVNEGDGTCIVNGHAK